MQEERKTGERRERKGDTGRNGEKGKEEEERQGDTGKSKEKRGAKREGDGREVGGYQGGRKEETDFSQMASTTPPSL